MAVNQEIASLFQEIQELFPAKRREFIERGGELGALQLRYAERLNEVIGRIVEIEGSDGIEYGELEKGHLIDEGEKTLAFLEGLDILASLDDLVARIEDE